MKCNLECPYARPNGRNKKGNLSIICECRNWFMTDADECIQNYDEKTISQIKSIFKVPTPHYEKFGVMTEIPTNKKTITNNVTGNDLTLEDACSLLNKQDQQIKEYEKKITKLEEIIDNRLDKNVRPKWQNNNELFIEEKVGYYYALEQLKKKLIREKICFNNINIEEWEF